MLIDIFFLQLSINASHVPSVNYESEAVASIQIAYELHPDNLDKRLEAISKGYTEKFSPKFGWKVAQSCQGVYQDNSLKGQTNFVIVNAKNSTSIFTIGIFD